MMEVAVSYSAIALALRNVEACTADENEIVSYCEAEIANEYGGGITAGVIRAVGPQRELLSAQERPGY